MALSDAAVAAVLGYAVVFLGIVLLMAVVILLGKVMVSRQKAATAAMNAAVKAAAPPAPAKPELPKAPGTAGEMKLYNTDPKTAAMLMAIVAERMGKPLNELRFKSIKEVK